MESKRKDCVNGSDRYASLTIRSTSKFAPAYSNITKAGHSGVEQKLMDQERQEL